MFKDTVLLWGGVLSWVGETFVTHLSYTIFIHCKVNGFGLFLFVFAAVCWFWILFFHTCSTLSQNDLEPLAQAGLKSWAKCLVSWFVYGLLWLITKLLNIRFSIVISNNYFKCFVIVFPFYIFKFKSYRSIGKILILYSFCVCFNI